jgi:hypothetical protein
MSETNLPAKVYRLPQYRFGVIPGSPWVYWVSDDILELFRKYPLLGEISPSIHGTATYDNFRFLRYWWETSIHKICLSCESWQDFENSGKRYAPYMKGGPFRRWYGNQEYVILLQSNGRALIEFLNTKRDSIRGQEYIFKVGVTYSFLTSGKFSARISPGGFIFDVAGSSFFPDEVEVPLALLNSKLAGYILKLLNPTVNFQVGDLARLPVTKSRSQQISDLVETAIAFQKKDSSNNEISYDFIVPVDFGLGEGIKRYERIQLANIENQIDQETYNLYGISSRDRNAINAEVNGESSEGLNYFADSEAPISQEDLAIRWISYAYGIVLDRFNPGKSGGLGSAIYQQEDFAVGSLPAPGAEDFNELVGQPEHFAYIEDQGGRHIFSPEVERALQELCIPDGIAVFDESQPRDLATLIRKALELMLGEKETQEVIQMGAGGDLRSFLEKVFFTKWHFKWYRKRPVYWPIQSNKRSYGFVIFHERVNKDTFYAIQQEPYLKTKRNAVALQMQDLQAQLERTSGSARKKLEKELADLQSLADELAEFARDLEEITLGGYEPEPDWIDDGVILRMAPLWKVIPIWKSEPKKYWERLEKGEYDWSHIAMNYWPERVREKCKTDKSFAIAHGHEEWYEGD